jgi:hypothetical protein
MSISASWACHPEHDPILSLQDKRDIINPKTYWFIEMRIQINAVMLMMNAGSIYNIL